MQCSLHAHKWWTCHGKQNRWQNGFGTKKPRKTNGILIDVQIIDITSNDIKEMINKLEEAQVTRASHWNGITTRKKITSASYSICLDCNIHRHCSRSFSSIRFRFRFWCVSRVRLNDFNSIDFVVLFLFQFVVTRACFVMSCIIYDWICWIYLAYSTRRNQIFMKRFCSFILSTVCAACNYGISRQFDLQHSNDSFIVWKIAAQERP